MIDIVFNTYLSRLFDWVIETTMMASILVGLILIVKILLRNKLTPRWHYLLWMILIVRLMLPWSPDSSFSIYSILLNGYESITSVQSQPISSSENERLQETTNILSGTKGITEEEPSTFNAPQMIEESKNKMMIHDEKPKDESEPLSVYSIALTLWLTGVIGLGFITYLSNRRLQNYIKQQPVITDERTVRIFEKCKESMSIQRNIPLLLAGRIPSPTVLGFFRPRVLLTSDQIKLLNEQQLRHIFYHELAHIKRKDVGMNWLIHCLLIINWFNPIIWYAYVRMREDQELACDAYALTFMEEEEKIQYGYTIINLLEHYANYYPVPSLANLSRNKRILKRRIFMVKNFKKKSYRWSALGIIAVVAIASVSLLNANAGGSNEKQKEKVLENESIKNDGREKGNKTLEKTDETKNQEQDNKTVQTINNNQSEETAMDYGDSYKAVKNFSYIVYDGYYYKLGEQVDQSKVGSQIGEVKRIGTWEIIKDGDSNEVPPGPIYSVVDKDPKEVIVAKQWSNRDVYVQFERESPVIQRDKSKIYSTKNDPEEVQIAVQNVRNDSSVLYEFKNQARLELTYISYDPNHSSTASLGYTVSEVDAGILSVKQYPKNEVPKGSAFIRDYVFMRENNNTIKKEINKEWKEPVLKESFVVNGIEWGKYETIYQEDVYRGEQQNLYFEISTQGEIDLSLMKEFLSSFEQSNNE
ncbi:M56 family metallopeptidase [Bacillus benzoevorans]|uniref:Beta-lactamase regulating signal transducer with metallopeptidase domain n=1 Tax=Bacillus benzoevorans TaxID=1456 RepID=A0A7X0LYT3_9BACI|nr:M56 family metallopeptidase [Bacillus benzoevorans]MBB6447852.1 beta-lactamase regulating signal transducer with metallopeptidase domain [Bacillus benzoevorans]